MFLGRFITTSSSLFYKKSGCVRVREQETERAKERERGRERERERVCVTRVEAWSCVCVTRSEA